jgi:hypothetical protein
MGVGLTGFTSSVTTIGVGEETSAGVVSSQAKRVFPEKIKTRQIIKQHTDRTRRTVMIIGRVDDFLFMNFPY